MLPKFYSFQYVNNNYYLFVLHIQINFVTILKFGSMQIGSINYEHFKFCMKHRLFTLCE